jgi:predicted N-acetyltransferase YhbS
MHIHLLAQHSSLMTALTQMLYREWSAYANWNTPELIEKRLLARNQPDVKTLTLLATAPEGSLMGSASLIHYELADVAEREFWIGEVITATEHRGKGVGSALITRLIAEAGARGISSLWLYTPDQQKLYQRFGWREVEQRLIDGEQVSVMVLQL